MKAEAATAAGSRQPDSGSDSRVFVGRQAIYDRKLSVYAYELLYRAGDKNRADVSDGDLATAEVLVSTLMDIGLERLVNRCLAFVNVTREFLLERRALSLPRDRVVLEVLEDVVVDDALIEAVTELAGQGYIIALDDFVYAERLQPLVSLADIVKIDVMALTRDEVQEHADILRAQGLKLLAEKIETQEEFETLKEMGFDYFQGYFLAKPRVVEGTRLPTNKLAVLQLAAALQDEQAKVSDIEQLVTQDVALSYKLFRYINSAFFNLSSEVTSIRRAVVCLGLHGLKRMVTLLTLARVDDKPNELLRMALVRGKMCEELAVAAGGVEPGTAFTGGLFSALDLLMDAPLARLLEELRLTEELRAALLDHRGRLGEIIACTLAYERCDWPAVVLGGVSASTIRNVYVASTQWSFQVYANLALGERGGS